MHSFLSSEHNWNVTASLQGGIQHVYATHIWPTYILPISSCHSHDHIKHDSKSPANCIWKIIVTWMGPYRPHHGLGKNIPFWISRCSTVHGLLSLDQLAPMRETTSWKAWFETGFPWRFPLLDLGNGGNKFALYWHIGIIHQKKTWR